MQDDPECLVRHHAQHGLHQVLRVDRHTADPNRLLVDGIWMNYESNDGEITLLSPSTPAELDSSWTTEQKQILGTIERLSEATAPGGGGADAYGKVLANDFSRWTMGSDLINTKKAWLDGMRTWFDEGWRVTDRDQTIVEIRVDRPFAFTRRVVEETYRGPDGDGSVSKAALGETWVRRNGVWLLYRVNVEVLDSR